MKKKNLSLLEINKLIKETACQIDKLIASANSKLPEGFELIILKDKPVIESKLSFTGSYCSIGSVINFSASAQKQIIETVKKGSSKKELKEVGGTF
ncbi:hypothetical protein [Pedobacter nototheniae]|uniref:hypothetical protein n=1 Tax=Pedobacter nototheniae TaxID=2488994 RepID=UPI00292EE665|nr:hypothetical protein [Pedobacter nototheniae]